jgi:oxygen-dependent protoporphyrinogen oxidase
MVSFPTGLHQLPRMLAARLPDLRLRSRVESIEGQAGLFTARGVDFSVSAPQLVVTSSGQATARLLDRVSEGKSRSLGEIPQASLAVVSLGYRRDQVDHPLDGFGFLAPRCEPLRILGCLFPSSVFPGRAPAGRVALSAFLGGRLDPEIVAQSDSDLLAVVESDLATALGTRGLPEFAEVTRWRPAIPQYELGHQHFVDSVRTIEAECPGLIIAGNFLAGASVPDCVTKGVRAAERVASALRDR